jgi:hypothetical protein
VHEPVPGECARRGRNQRPRLPARAPAGRARGRAGERARARARARARLAASILAGSASGGPPEWLAGRAGRDLLGLWCLERSPFPSPRPFTCPSSQVASNT